MRFWRFCMSAALLVTIAAGPAIAAEEKDEAKKESKTPAVLPVFALKSEIVEAPQGDDLLFSTGTTESLKDLVARMKKVRDDDSVRAVVLLLEGASLGSAQTEEIRQVMDEIKAAGKPIHVHTNSLSTGSYLLLSGASKISVVPTGDVWITGLYGESPYVRGLLDFLGVTPDYLTCGKYKSAAEMFMRNGPSPEAEEMQNWLVDSKYDTYLQLIAEGRGVNKDQVREWIDNAPYTAEKAKELGIIDAVQYRQDFVEGLKSEYGEAARLDLAYGKKKRQQIDFSNPFGILQFWGTLLQGPTTRKSTKPAVAIVYVDGPIMLGDAESGWLSAGSTIAYSTPIRKALDEVAKDESIKAVVLRVNSPGGSAVASEIILDATRRVKDKKPFVVSMGDVAGSGGYYVACGSDKIFADASTITGSIGVVAGKFATTSMWGKVGIHWKPVRRGANAGMLSTARVFTDEEREKLQSWMNEIYEVFKGHVVAARGERLKKDIDELAGGRVFTGRQALELGLVDEIGTLDDAVKYVAKKADLDDDYEVRVVPQPKNFLESLFGDLAGGASDEKSIAAAARSLAARRPTVSLVDMALPLLEGFEPRRMQAIRAALERLELMQKERVILMMPEFIFHD